MPPTLSKSSVISTLKRSWPIRPAKPRELSRGKIDGPFLLGAVKFLAAVATVAGVIVAALQLMQLNEGAKIDRANQACEHFLTSEDTRDLSDEIFQKTNGGKDYAAAQKDPKLRQVIEYYLNDLEMIAGNVNNGVYDQRVVFSHLAQIIYKQTRAQLYGQGGRTPAGDWAAEKPLFTNNEYPELRKLYKRWFPDDMYRDTLP
ncbi:hypothetical protein SAMN05414139_01495 [Burkholderia sp. D7]|nr:hypothetical protein SAMN05414139_01495 [Burkholderia sp. D7]